MYAESPQRLILTGKLDTPEVDRLADYCKRLHQDGQKRLELNLDHVTDCSETGLYGLLALTEGGPEQAEVRIEGAHWGQFMIMLTRAPVTDVQRLCDGVRQLVRPASQPRPTTMT